MSELMAIGRNLAIALGRGKAKHSPLPRLWLMTDATRLADPLPAIARLPRGAGVIYRHYGRAEREALGRAVAQACRARGLRLMVAEDAGLALSLRADGVHLPERALGRLRHLKRQGWMVTAAVHNARSLRQARDADAVLLSPVFPTPSHPGAQGLGRLRFAALATRSQAPVLALGGVNAATLRRLRGSRAYGVAGIGWAG
jgi:thiamine-phosphate pyrophosphorylase